MLRKTRFISYHLHERVQRVRRRKHFKEFEAKEPIESRFNMEITLDVAKLTSSIGNRLGALPADSYRVCIYKVSQKRRKANEEAYTPRLVSIGPLHHGMSQLQGMEVYKSRCLYNFISRFEVDLNRLVNFVAQEENNVRGYYEETIKLKPEEFAEMILLDCIFVVELFLKNYFVQMREPSDIIFENRWMSNDLLHDMLLLENQIPLSVTHGLFHFIDASFICGLSFYDLAREYFKNVGSTGKLQVTEDCSRAKHLVEFLIFLHKPSHERKEPSRGGKFEYTRSATELQEAGVEFVKSENAACLFEVRFDKGELRIPKLTVNDSTETFFRNLIAFEQCGYYSKHMTSYVILMDSLINTAKDVDLLVQNEIIDNDLGESEQVADLFNNLYKEVMKDTSDFYFAKQCEDLNAYSRDCLHNWKAKWFRWKVMLGRDYFGNPWSAFSLAGAIFLLLLTILQAVCSVLQVKNS